MARPAVRTDRTDCRTCEAKGIEARTILAKGFPPLDWWPDPHGNIAVMHEASGAYTARWLGQGEAPVGIEKRHSKHECGRMGEPQ